MRELFTSPIHLTSFNARANVFELTHFPSACVNDANAIGEACMNYTVDDFTADCRRSLTADAGEAGQ